MSVSLRILAMTGDGDLAARLRDVMSGPVQLADNWPDFRRALAEDGPFDCVVVADQYMGQLAELGTERPPFAVVILTEADGTERLPVNYAFGRTASCRLEPHQLARAIGDAVEIAQLRSSLTATQADMNRRIDALSILYEVSTAATDVASYDEIVEIILRALSRIVQFDLGTTILAYDPSVVPVLHLHCREACTDSLLHATRDRALELYASLTGMPVDEGQLAVNVSGDRMTTGVQATVMASATHIPLLLEGRLIGLIYLAACREQAFSPKDNELLTFLANRTVDTVRRLAARIHDERRKLSLMVESMADGLIMTDPHSEVVLINPAARQLLSITDDATVVTRQYLKDRLGFYPFDLVATRAVAPNAANTQQLVREELKIADKVLHSIVSPVRDGGGRLVGVVVVLRDITEATELARRKEEFVSVVSHELRTPLTSVTGALDIVLKEYVGAIATKQRQYLQMARDSCARLNVIVDDLLDVARSERGRMPMRFQPILLDELSHEAVNSYRPASEAKGISLRVSTEETNIRIIGDADRLTQVLNNLLSNAIKFTPAQGLIDIEIFGPSVASSHVGVSVFNNGEPIPAAARERVFDKFEQIQMSSTRRVGGTGLGLAISRAIIEAHRGRIWVEPRGDGTKFVFTLPAAPGTTEDADSSNHDVDFSGEAAPHTQSSTVLLLGGEGHTLLILKGILMAAGHTVLVASDADQALTLARQHHPELLAVDIGCLQDDPFSLIEIVQHDPDTKKARILVITSSDEQARERALDAGAAGVLSKPIDDDEFLTVCNRLVAEAGKEAAARILIVDDDAAIRMICREVLEGEGYAIREADSGENALIAAKRYRPDLMLLDVMMPDLDGFQTAQRFRTDTTTSLTPVIFLSARGETADKVRAFRIGAEDYIVKPFDAAELVARVEKALERRNRELGASPTTQLPGAGAIEHEIEKRLRARGDHAFCYLDLDNLKAFNDYYGYAKADGIIRQTGDLIREVIAREGADGDFIGHIAGDDFVFITDSERVDTVCLAIIETFDRLVPLYYNRGDRERGYIQATDRYGVERKFPVMGVSVCTVTGAAAPLDTFAGLATAAAAGKKIAKEVGGSAYVRDGKLVLTNPRPLPQTP